MINNKSITVFRTLGKGNENELAQWKQLVCWRRAGAAEGGACGPDRPLLCCRL